MSSSDPKVVTTVPAGSSKRPANDDTNEANKKSQTIDSRAESQQTFKKLPEEVKSRIFGLMSFKDLMTSTLVCKDWNKVIGENVRLTNKINFRYPDIPNETSNSIDRKYINLEIHKMPSKAEYSTRFSGIRVVVRSIKLSVHKKHSYENVRDLLEFFPNLNSLYINQEYGWNGQASDAMFLEPTNDAEVMNLNSLQSLTIRAFEPSFAKTMLHAVNVKNVKLHTFKFGGLYLKRSMDQQVLLSDEFTEFLNSQSNLKILELSCSNPPILVPSQLDLKFKLESLAIRGSALMNTDSISNAPGCHELMRKILGTCIDSCKTLHLLELQKQSYETFIKYLVDFTKLETLLFEFVEFDFNPENFPTFSSMLAPRTMRCQLKKLIIFSEETFYLKLNADNVEGLLTLLLKQKDSLESLTVMQLIPYGHRAWTTIGSQMKLKFICAQLSKTVLKKMRGSSLEKLINTKDGPLRDTDAAFWQKFRKRNPNFKSIEANRYGYFTEIGKALRFIE